MGNFGLENRIKQAKEYSGEKLIIQADGYPMSGGEDDYNTTLQAVATADVINKAFNMELNKRKKKIVYKKNREVTIFGREEKFDMHLSVKKVFFGTAVAAVHLVDIEQKELK